MSLGAVTAAHAPPAEAHPGTTVYRIGVGTPANIGILVPADYGKPITEVDITAPSGFRLDGGEPPQGWRMSRSQATLAFTGGTIPADDPGAVFTLQGAARAQGVLIFPITTRSPDGTVMEYRGNPTAADAGAVVYAGRAPGIPGASGPRWKAIGGGALVAIGVVGTTVLVLRRRRQPASGPPGSGPPVSDPRQQVPAPGP